MWTIWLKNIPPCMSFKLIYINKKALCDISVSQRAFLLCYCFISMPHTLSTLPSTRKRTSMPAKDSPYTRSGSF